MGHVPEGHKRDVAYNQMRRLLILQQVPPGSRLTEAEWSQRLGVNRSALREAFARLQAEGLIQAGAKTGYVVPELRREDIFEVLWVRLALEGSAIEIICEASLNTPQRLERMQGACDLLEHLVDQEYHLSTVEADWRFHEALIEASGNRRLAIAYRHAPVPILHPDITWGATWVQRSQQTVREHRAILAAILQGDIAGAKALLRTHLVGPWEQQSSPAQKNHLRAAGDSPSTACTATRLTPP